MITRGRVLAGVVALAAMIVPLTASAKGPGANPGTPQLLASLAGGAASGSAIGPGGALYVPQPATGEIWRIDPQSGAKTLYASGLPKRFLGLPFGGVMDVAFNGSTAYALVSVVGSAFPADLVSCHPGIGIYRIDGPTSATVVADIGAFACANPPPPTFPIVVPTGVQYAMEPFRGGFLVTDGHHNRVLYATLDGNVSVLQQFGDAVPTGLAVSGNTVYLAEAGPVPHLPQNGKVVSFTFAPGPSTTTDVAAGARLAVDVELGRGRTLFALSQGHFTCPDPNDCASGAGSPADPNTGALLRANDDGTFTTVADGLNRPSSLEIIGNTAYVVTLGGEIWTIDDIASPPYG